MEEHYPFTGTGNLFNFCKGLMKINILNNILVLFDNDAAGSEKYESCKTIIWPSNMKICKLPSLEFFNSFLTIGPSGTSNENINGKAVSIECFLDLHTIPKEKQIIRWNSYNSKIHQYQGEIEGKQELVIGFKKAIKDNANKYDMGRLKILTDYIYNSWIL